MVLLLFIIADDTVWVTCAESARACTVSDILGSAVSTPASSALGLPRKTAPSGKGTASRNALSTKRQHTESATLTVLKRCRRIIEINRGPLMEVTPAAAPAQQCSTDTFVIELGRESKQSTSYASLQGCSTSRLASMLCDVTVTPRSR